MFTYSKTVEDLLVRQIKSSTFGCIACAMVGIIGFVIISDKSGYGFVLPAMFFAIIFGALCLFEFFRIMRCAKVRGNLIKCCLDIDDGKIKCHSSNNFEIPNSVFYFEIDACDIRNVEILHPSISVNREYSTLKIEHRNGDVKIPIADSEAAARLIKELVE